MDICTDKHAVNKRSLIDCSNNRRSTAVLIYTFNELRFVNGITREKNKKKKKEDLRTPARIFLFLISDLIVIEARV